MSQMNYSFVNRLRILFFSVCSAGFVLAVGFVLLGSATDALAAVGVNESVLVLTKRSSNEPLVGGRLAYQIVVENTANTGEVLEDDKAYNVTVTDTLPAGLSFTSASPTPDEVVVQTDGTTLIIWTDLQDLEQQETLSIDLVTAVDPSLGVGTSLLNSADASGVEFPDGTGAVFTATGSDVATLQAIDIEKALLQSTGVNQTTGASGWEDAASGTGGGAEWIYQYTLSIQNNPISGTENVIVTDRLPSGIAYMGSPVVSPNPNGVSVIPTQIVSGTDLLLIWDLGVLGSDQYTTPIEITFDTAIPYRERAGENGTAACVMGDVRVPNSTTPSDLGCFDGPIITDHSVWHNNYDVTGVYNGLVASDGSTYTPADDETIPVTAVFETVQKSASVDQVAYGDTIDYTIEYFVSEYYTLTGSVITDVLPDGLSYVAGSASVVPTSVVTDSPTSGQTTIVWVVGDGNTTPGSQQTITFRAETATTYEGLIGQPPLVAVDSLINEVTMAGNFTDDVDPAGGYTGVTTDSDTAAVETEKPSIEKKVYDPDTGEYVDGPVAIKVGETLTYRLVYRAPAGVDARSNYLVDFLPSELTYVSQLSCTTSGTISNTFSIYDTDQDPCTSGQYAVTSNLNAIRWNYGFVSTGFVMTTTFEAQVSESPDVQEGTIFRNILKASGVNTVGSTYSLRDSALIEIDGTVQLTKTVSPDSNLDAGDVVTYRIEYGNIGVITTYNHIVTDTVPVGLVINTANCTPATCQIVGGGPITGSGGVITWTGAAVLAPGETGVLTYTAVISSNAVSVGGSLVNTATVSYNTRSDGSGLQTDGSTDPDDKQTDTAAVTPIGFSVTKTIEATSEAHTGVSGDGGREKMAIGEIARFRIVTELPEGTYSDLIIRDAMPAGMRFLDDDTAKIAFIYDSGITASGLTVTGCTLNDDSVAMPALTDNKPECVVPDNVAHSHITKKQDKYKSGTDVYFRLGAVENIDNDANIEYIVIELNAMLVNYPVDITNNFDNHVNDAGDSLSNVGAILIDGIEAARSEAARVRVVEPLLLLDKQSSHVGTVAPYETVTYTLSITNAGQGRTLDRDSTTAFNVRLYDALPPNFVLTQIITGFPGYVVETNSSTSDVIDFELDQLQYGDRAVVTITGYIDPVLSPQTIITNSAVVSYTSLPGDHGTTSNETGSSTVEDNGADYGPRDGSQTNNNDYHAADDTAMVLAADYGDLPGTYSTLTTSHIISDSLFLGSVVDTELLGQSSGDATGDGDDEDGVLRGGSSLWTPGATVPLTVTVGGGSGRLVGWFDWDNDGLFSSGEMVDFGLISGEQGVMVTVGAGYTTGATLNARFRLFDTSALPSGAIGDASTGVVAGGEVEDYQWFFSPTAVTMRFVEVASPVSSELYWLLLGFVVLSLLTAGVLWRERA